MATFHHIISILGENLVSYQLPFNQFSIPRRLIFMDPDVTVPMEPDSFIFCEAQAFSACISQTFPSKSCFFVSSSKDELPESIPHTCNYIACNLPWPVLCSRIVQLYQNYEVIQKKLTKSFGNRIDIKNYMNMLSALTGASCGLYDVDYRLLFSSDVTDDNMPVPQLLQKSGQFLHISHQTISSQTFYLEFFNSIPFSELDIRWIASEALNHILQNMIDHNIPIYSQKEHAAEQLIADIMDEKLSNFNEVFERYAALAAISPTFTCIVYILMPDFTSALNHVLFMSELTRLFPDNVIGAYENDFIMFLPNPEKATTPDLHYSEFNWVLEKYDAFAGCSLHTKFRFHTNIILAQATARFGREMKLEKNTHVYFHNNYFIYYLIDLAAASFEQIHHSKDLTYLIHPAVLKLNNYDRDHNTNLLEILYQYLMNGCSVNETAIALNVHRNTIQSKINKLTEMIPDDFTRSGITQSRLLISCMIFFYQIRYSRVPFLRPQMLEYSFKNLDQKKDQK